MNIVISVCSLILGVASFLICFQIAEKMKNRKATNITQYLGIILFVIGNVVFWLIGWA